MADHRFIATFRGVRGSVCCPGPDTLRYGGHTSCIEVRVDDHHRLLLDCGTGLPSVASAMPPGGSPRRFDVLFTHYHWDHVQGLPFFAPLYDPEAHFTFHGFPVRDRGVRELLETAIGPPWFPVALSDTPSTKHYLDLTGAPLEVGPFIVHSVRLSHPQGVTAYRIEHGDGAMVVATDVECGNDEDDAALVELSRDVDVLVHDAQYTPDELPKMRGRGHSSWRQAVDTARRSGARRLILFHHDPHRTDADIDALVREAARELPAVEGAREGSELEF